MLDSQQGQLREPVVSPKSAPNPQPVRRKWDSLGDLQDLGFSSNLLAEKS